MNKTNVKANPSTTHRHGTPNNKTHIIKFRVTETEKLELVGAKPLHLAIARPFCRLKAPLGLLLLCKRGLANRKTPSSLDVHSHPSCATFLSLIWFNDINFPICLARNIQISYITQIAFPLFSCSLIGFTLSVKMYEPFKILHYFWFRYNTARNHFTKNMFSFFFRQPLLL